MRRPAHSILAVSAGALFLCLTPSVLAQSAQDQPQTTHIQPRHFTDGPPVHFEAVQTADHQPRMILTNLHQYALTAFVVRLDPTAPNSLTNTLVYDALARVGLLSPIPRGLSFLVGVPHPVGQSVPDPVLAAAVWEDGSSYGPDELLARMPKTRAALANSYNRAITLLQIGLDKNWTAAEYLAAVEERRSPQAGESLPPGPDAAANTPMFNIKINMERMDKQNRTPAVVASMARNLLTQFTHDRDALRQALDGSASAANPKN